MLADVVEELIEEGDRPSGNRWLGRPVSVQKLRVTKRYLIKEHALKTLCLSSQGLSTAIAVSPPLL
ncbi:MAG: hypothetical protein WCD53_29585 [Microcoleus sp.]